MPAFSYQDFRYVLAQLGFVLVRSRKHEIWRKVQPDGTILQVAVSHQRGRDIPRSLFLRMLRQAGISEEEFGAVLRGRR